MAPAQDIKGNTKHRMKAACLVSPVATTLMHWSLTSATSKE